MRDEKTRVFIVGLGLIGGSLGLALRASGRYTATGFDADEPSLDRAVAIGAIDHAASSMAEAAGADLAVVATPLLAMPSVFAELGSHLRERRGRSFGSPGTVVTDVGSAKGFVMAHARQHFAPDIPFVGGHPLAGSEHQGIEHAAASLFTGCRYVLTPGEWAGANAVSRVTEACKAAGAIAQIMDPHDHDAMVAATSHLPLVVAACVANVVGRRAEAFPSIWDMAASGFRDTTRVASGSPEMGAGMLTANCARVLDALDEFQVEMDRIRRQIEAVLSGTSPASFGEVETFLSRARAHRQIWLDLKERTRASERGTSEKGGVNAWLSPMH
ncbi:MAG: prephenate dehydrogenase/arogenate dehydrogenase family protein [Bacillota bacterium]